MLFSVSVIDFMELVIPLSSQNKLINYKNYLYYNEIT